ncbi:MAG TPA: hypothetical protein VNN80_02270 [Polyangiaceae bacterium]|nr:hypothetical protein [Polyangiaceae bacterium]
MIQKRLIGGVAAALLAAQLSSARAQDAADDAARAKARALGYAGVEAYQAGDHAAASAKLEESYQLLPVPSLGLWSARALVQLGRWVAAEERYRAVAALTVASSDSPVQQQAKADAQSEREDLLRRIPSLKVRIVGAGAEEVSVRVDGAVRSTSELATTLLLDPGRHEVSGVRGSERSQVVLSLAERAHEEVELRFSGEPLPAPDSPALAPVAVAGPLTAAEPAPIPVEPEPGTDARHALRVGGWVAVGAGAAGLTTSLVSFVLANQQYESFERRDLCTSGGCSQDEVDTYNTLRDVQRVSLIAGGVLAAAGATVLVLTWGEPAEKQQVQLGLGPMAAQLSGTF